MSRFFIQIQNLYGMPLARLMWNFMSENEFQKSQYCFSVFHRNKFTYFDFVKKHKISIQIVTENILVGSKICN